MERSSVTRTGLAGAASIIVFLALAGAPSKTSHTGGFDSGNLGEHQNSNQGFEKVQHPNPQAKRSFSVATVDIFPGNKSKPKIVTELEGSINKLTSPWDGLEVALMTYVFIDEMLRRRWGIFGRSVKGWTWIVGGGVLFGSVLLMWFLNLDAASRWLTCAGWTVAVWWENIVRSIDGPWMHRLVSRIRDRIAIQNAALSAPG